MSTDIRITKNTAKKIKKLNNKTEVSIMIYLFSSFYLFRLLSMALEIITGSIASTVM